MGILNMFKKGKPITAVILDFSAGDTPFLYKKEGRIIKNSKGTYDVLVKGFGIKPLPKEKDIKGGYDPANKRYFYQFVTFDGIKLHTSTAKLDKERQKYKESAIPEEDDFWSNQKIVEIVNNLDSRKKWEQYMPLILMASSFMIGAVLMFIAFLMFKMTVQDFAVTLAGGISHTVKINATQLAEAFMNMTKPY